MVQPSSYWGCKTSGWVLQIVFSLGNEPFLGKRSPKENRVCHSVIPSLSYFFWPMINRGQSFKMKHSPEVWEGRKESRAWEQREDENRGSGKCPNWRSVSLSGLAAEERQGCEKIPNIGWGNCGFPPPRFGVAFHDSKRLMTSESLPFRVPGSEAQGREIWSEGSDSGAWEGLPRGALWSTSAGSGCFVGMLWITAFPFSSALKEFSSVFKELLETQSFRAWAI